MLYTSVSQPEGLEPKINLRDCEMINRKGKQMNNIFLLHKITYINLQCVPVILAFVLWVTGYFYLYKPLKRDATLVYDDNLCIPSIRQFTMIEKKEITNSSQDVIILQRKNKYNF